MLKRTMHIIYYTLSFAFVCKSLSSHFTWYNGHFSGRITMDYYYYKYAVIRAIYTDELCTHIAQYLYA